MITEKNKKYLSLMENNIYSPTRLANYIKDCGGIKKLRTEDLDEIIRVRPSDETISDPRFMDYYKIVSTNESGRIMKIWTWIAGIAAVVSAGTSVISLSDNHHVIKSIIHALF
jgi:hypothetical protein